ncbi:TPA: WD repeat domain 86 [Bos taurus]|nr:TPA: WD repeat domain 86 [Bos taurus]
MGGGGSALRVCADHRGGINWLSLSPDGQRLLTGSEDGTARLWSTADGTCCALLQGHESYVTFCQLEDEAAFTCSADCTIRKWDVLTGQCLQVFRGHTSIVNRILVADNQLFSSSYDRTARAWSVDRGQVAREFRGHCNCVLTLAYAGAPCMEEAVAGGLLVTGSTDATAKVWQVASGCCHQTLRGHTGAVLCLVLDAPGHTAFTGSTDATVRAWDILSGQQLRVFREHQGSVICLEVYVPAPRFDQAADMIELILTMEVNFSHLVHEETEAQRGLSNLPRVSQPRGLVKGKMVYVQGPLGTVRTQGPGEAGRIPDSVYRARGAPERPGAGGGTKQEPCCHQWWHRRREDSGNPQSLCLSDLPKAKSDLCGGWAGKPALKAGSADRTVKCWLADTGERVRTFTAHRHSVSALKYHAGTLFTGSGDARARAFDAQSGALRRVFRGHAFVINCIQVHGQVLYTASHDGALRLWDVRGLPPPRAAAPKRSLSRLFSNKVGCAAAAAPLQPA